MGNSQKKPFEILPKIKVLFIGLDNSGKSLIVSKLGGDKIVIQ